MDHANIFVSIDFTLWQIAFIGAQLVIRSQIGRQAHILFGLGIVFWSLSQTGEEVLFMQLVWQGMSFGAIHSNYREIEIKNEREVRKTSSDNSDQ